MKKPVSEKAVIASTKAGMKAGKTPQAAFAAALKKAGFKAKKK